MSTSTPIRPALPRPDPPRRTGPLHDLDRASDAFASLGPNWFASVMGTGIVATAAATLPVQWPGLREFATVVWVLAAGWLVVLAAAEIVHWARHREAALGHARNPVMVQYYGAPPMALLTVGAGTLLLGPAVLGAHAALIVDAVLWPLGTLGGLASSLAVPYLMFTRLRAAPDAAFGGWLMPVVPPMVSAATGALLIPHLPAGQARLSLLLACYAMFGISLIASLVVITQVWQRLVRHSIGPAAMVPTLWIVLGPLGQSITAASLLGGAARLVLPYPYGPAFQAFGLVYGVPVWGFTVLWATLATAITVRAARAHLPFSLTWWSFTFPVGTVVTGTTGLALHTGDGMFRWAAAGLYLVLVAAWAVVSVRTVAGTWRGSLLRAPAAGMTAAGGPAKAGVPAAGEVAADGVAELTLTGKGSPACLPSLVHKSAAGGHRASPRGGRVAAGMGVTPMAGGSGRSSGLARVLAVGLAAVSLAWPWPVPAQAATAGTTHWDTAQRDDAGAAAIRPPSTVVTLTFDDGDADQMTAARVLRRRGLAATFYIITGAVGTPGYVTRSDLRQLAADGDEIGGHTVSHLRLTALSSAEARRQVCESRSILARWGYR